MTFDRLLARDLREILRCPDCGAADLLLDGDALRCAACGTAFAVDTEKGIASLVPAAADSAVKQDIRAWWGDLYRQLYAGHEEGIDSAALEARLAETEDLFHRRRMTAVVEMPLADLAGKRVLEIGSGAGAHSAIFKRHGASMVSVDITPERVMATARKLALVRGGEGRAYQADAERLPFRDDSFDIVYSNGVLHHSEDTDRCIAEVLRVLKPGGKAAIMLYSRHSAIYWAQVAPRALLTGEFFRWPEPQWIGRLTEGKPKHGQTKNPITRVYSAAQLRRLFAGFRLLSLRKSSFQFDNFLFPRLTQIRNAILKALGHRAHPGGILVYGGPFVPETDLELFLGRHIGFAWNILAEKPE
jgi:ubiquinone/menaquinone biosynthesis C-methylase UbiE